MIRRFSINSHDTVQQILITHFINEQGQLLVKPEYLNYTCEKCLKISELTALSIVGINKMKIQSKRPFFTTSDDYNVLHGNAIEVFESIIPNSLNYIKIPETAFSVATGKMRFVPVQGTLGFRFLDRCNLCGRWGQLLNDGTTRHVPFFDDFLSICYDVTLGLSESWIVDESVAEQFKAKHSKLTGIAISEVKLNIS
jgi:hypothetical protein